MQALGFGVNRPERSLAPLRYTVNILEPEMQPVPFALVIQATPMPRCMAKPRELALLFTACKLETAQEMLAIFKRVMLPEPMEQGLPSLQHSWD